VGEVSNLNLFESDRMLLAESIRLTADSLNAYGAQYQHWAMAFSGGKDSTALVTLVAHLIETGKVKAPKSLTALYADTRMELPPLQISATGVLEELRERGIDARVVLPALDDRYFVYMLGRGVPPPKNRFRWCTSQIKIEPMIAALKDLRDRTGEKILMLTGVRLGESAARDTRIVTSCSRDGAECGQGWFQESTPEAVADTLAPILHFRVCHIWAWLTTHAPNVGFPTTAIAAAYGGDEAEEANARTGCIGCPLASKDVALDGVIRQPGWEYLAPLKRLKPLYSELSFDHQHRVRKVQIEIRKDGLPAKNPQRVGPLSMEARRYGLDIVLGVQDEINQSARRLGRPQIDLLNQEERSRILDLIGANTWPRGWDGTEIPGDSLIDRIHRDGTVQPLLPVTPEGDQS
jgi:DNA sulfur modification protein DndC